MYFKKMSEQTKPDRRPNCLVVIKPFAEHLLADAKTTIKLVAERANEKRINKTTKTDVRAAKPGGGVRGK